MDSEAAAICRATGLPYVYRVWPAEMAGSVPYPHMRYWREDTVRILADNETYLYIDEYEVLLVTEQKDEVSEMLVERAFAEAGVMPSNPHEDWIASERLFQVSWNFKLIRNDATEQGESGESGESTVGA